MITPFCSPAEVGRLLDSGRDVVLADCRWYLDGRSGREAYLAGHLPGAVFVDLDADLAGPVDATSGRHPLPTPEDFARTRARLGMGPDAVVIGYDDAGGVIAARLVWMLRAIGVDAAVLEGGLSGWQASASTRAAEPRSVESQRAQSQRVEPQPWPADVLADIDAVGDPSAVVLDARPRERYRGEGDDVDPRSGHIPGARNLPCRENLDTDDRLLPSSVLSDRLDEIGVTRAKINAGEVISSCGSGVTACHSLLVIEQLGLGRARLYPGSWSQYAATDRPIATGE
ncbi:MAG: sulfurtransferase [Actinomycetales bacterium]